MTKSNIPAPTFNEFSLESVGEILSTKLVTPDLVDKLNALANNEELSQTFKDNLISFTTVLTKGSFTPAQYVSAVQYVSYRLMGHGIRAAWEKTFPERYKRLLKKGVHTKTISSHSSAYNKTKLVNLVMEQSLIPSYIINNHYFQEALDIQVELMNDPDVSPKVRSDAAGKVLEYTAMPDALVNNKEEISKQGMTVIAKLAESVAALAQGKRTMIIDGSISAKDVARIPIYGQDTVEEAEIVNE